MEQRLKYVIFILAVIYSLTKNVSVNGQGYTYTGEDVNVIFTNDTCVIEGSQAASVYKCGMSCFQTRCAGFAISPPDGGDQTCVCVTSPSELPQGSWTLYRRHGGCH